MVNVKLAPYKSIEIETDEGNQIISEGEKVSFIVEDTGELRKGIIVGFKGSKPEKVEVEIIPENCKHRETWHILEMREGSLKLVVDGEDENEEEEVE